MIFILLFWTLNLITLVEGKPIEEKVPARKENEKTMFGNIFGRFKHFVKALHSTSGKDSNPTSWTGTKKPSDMTQKPFRSSLETTTPTTTTTTGSLRQSPKQGVKLTSPSVRKSLEKPKSAKAMGTTSGKAPAMHKPIGKDMADNRLKLRQKKSIITVATTVSTTRTTTPYKATPHPKCVTLKLLKLPLPSDCHNQGSIWS